MGGRSEGSSGALRLAERIIQLLDQASFSATYKYAVLIALMDLCLERTSATGSAPDILTTHLLAEKVLALYWPQSAPYEKGEVLRQSTAGRTGQAEILRRIISFREQFAQGSAVAPTLLRARAERPARYKALLHFVEWKLIEMPLPRLQVIGRQEDRFLYEYNWTSAIEREKRRVVRYQAGDQHAFDNRILLKPSVGECLIQLNGVLRPLIYRQWTVMVARVNKLPEAVLENFLFGVDRVSLARVRGPLLDIQERRCFYCMGPIDDRCEVDHFIPWARHPDNGIDNLVASHARCNHEKRDFLAAADHVEHWRARSLHHADELQVMAEQARWERAPERTVSVARAIYQKLPDDARLWRLKDEFVGFDRSRITAALSAQASPV
jgi:hypothetical protein